MATAIRPPVGSLLRNWRRRRRLSQLDLALDAGVSARHLSFVETAGARARSDRELARARGDHAPIMQSVRPSALLLVVRSDSLR